MSRPIDSKVITVVILGILLLFSSIIYPTNTDNGKNNQIYSITETKFDVGTTPSMPFQEGSIYPNPYSAGANHYCMIGFTENLTCRGQNGSTQLGDKDISANNVDLDYSGFGKPSKISSGKSHTCSISDRNLVICWGSNDFGQSAGRLTSNDVVGPTHVQLQNLPFGSVSVGDSHSCGITIIGEIYCWGALFYDFDLHNDPYYEPVMVSSQIEQRFDSIASGPNHSCALTTTKEAYCWGSNDYGQITAGGGEGFYAEPQLVLPGKKIEAVSLGMNFSCFIDESRSLFGVG